MKKVLIRVGFVVWASGLLTVLLSLRFASYSLLGFFGLLLTWSAVIAVAIGICVRIVPNVEVEENRENKQRDEEECRKFREWAKLFAHSKWRVMPLGTWQWQGEVLRGLYDDGWDVVPIQDITQDTLSSKGMGYLALESLSPQSCSNVAEIQLRIPPRHPALEKLTELVAGSIVEFEFHEEPIPLARGTEPAAYLTIRSKPMLAKLPLRAVH
ncbi:MAG: hypothetical protein HYT69_00900 [Candidatus Zambryskibacteria bacterium]|nr:hypothetical protein [Candidatus Zambryskibacteria bacterium]